MELQYRMENGRLTAALTGELGHHEALGLMDRLGRLAEAWLPGEMVLDLGGLEFMDSSGIGMMIGRYKRMRSRGGTMGVMAGDARIERMMELSGLYQIVDKLA